MRYPKKIYAHFTADNSMDVFFFPLELLMAARIIIEQRKFILKFYWKCGNAVEAQRQFRSEFQANSPTRLTITRSRDKIEPSGTVQNVHEKRSGRPRTSPTATK